MPKVKNLGAQQLTLWYLYVSLSNFRIKHIGLKGQMIVINLPLVLDPSINTTAGGLTSHSVIIPNKSMLPGDSDRFLKF